MPAPTDAGLNPDCKG